MSGQDAEDTNTDVDGSDCDKFCNTFIPADIFKTDILDTLHCLFCSGRGIDDLAVLHIVFSKDSHFHLLSVLICNTHFLSLKLTLRKGPQSLIGCDGSRS